MIHFFTILHRKSNIYNKVLTICTPCRVGFVVSTSASHTVGHEIASRPGHAKDHHKNCTNCLLAWHWGHALKMSPGINCKSRVSYPGSGFLSRAPWPSLPRKHIVDYNLKTKQFAQ